MSDIRKDALTFEAVKVSMQQNKEGHILRLAIHPNDTPEDVLRFPVGTRFQVALVAINDEGQPVAGPITREANKTVQASVMLCKDENFQTWMWDRGLATMAVESAVAEGLREYLDIPSRSALKEDSEARKMFRELAAEFRDTFGRL